MTSWSLNPVETLFYLDFLQQLPLLTLSSFLTYSPLCFYLNSQTFHFQALPLPIPQKSITLGSSPQSRPLLTCKPSLLASIATYMFMINKSIFSRQTSFSCFRPMYLTVNWTSQIKLTIFLLKPILSSI